MGPAVPGYAWVPSDWTVHRPPGSATHSLSRLTGSLSRPHTLIAVSVFLLICAFITIPLSRERQLQLIVVLQLTAVFSVAAEKCCSSLQCLVSQLIVVLQLTAVFSVAAE